MFRVAAEEPEMKAKYEMDSQFLEIVKFLFNNGFYLFLLIALSISTTRRLTTSLVKANSKHEIKHVSTRV